MKSLAGFRGGVPDGVWGKAPTSSFLPLRIFAIFRFAVVAEGGLRRRKRRAASRAPFHVSHTGSNRISRRSGYAPERLLDMPAFGLLGIRDLHIGPVSIVDRCAVCSETAFLWGVMGAAAPIPLPGDQSPGNSHSRAASGTPCDSRRSACLFPPLAAAGFGPPDPFFASRGFKCFYKTPLTPRSTSPAWAARRR